MAPPSLLAPTPSARGSSVQTAPGGLATLVAVRRLAVRTPQGPPCTFLQAGLVDLLGEGDQLRGQRGHVGVGGFGAEAELQRDQPAVAGEPADLDAGTAVDAQH